MNTFTIENETNNITLHASTKEAEMVPDSERFSSEAALAKLAVNWPAGRLIDVWNSIPGTSPVKKFTDRQTAVSRIWKAIQTLDYFPPAAAPEEQRSGSRMCLRSGAGCPCHADRPRRYPERRCQR